MDQTNDLTAQPQDVTWNCSLQGFLCFPYFLFFFASHTHPLPSKNTNDQRPTQMRWFHPQGGCTGKLFFLEKRDIERELWLVCSSFLFFSFLFFSFLFFSFLFFSFLFFSFHFLFFTFLFYSFLFLSFLFFSFLFFSFLFFSFLFFSFPSLPFPVLRFTFK